MMDCPKLWRMALACWLVLGLAVAVRNYLKPTSHTVYPVFAEGARHWWAGQSLYEEYEGLDRFRYSPAFAVAMTPFARLDDRLGSILWSWVCLGVYWYGLRRMIAEVKPGRWPAAFEPIFLILALLGGLSGLWNGQSNALLIGLILWGCAALIRQQWWWAAALWSSCLLVKLPLLAVVLLLVALYPRRLIGPLCVCLLGGAALPFLTQPPDRVCLAYQEWAVQLSTTSTHRWPGFRDAWSVWELFQSPVAIPLYRALQLVTAASALGFCLLQRRESPQMKVLHALGMGIAWLMVFGPATEFATYVWLAPLVSWAVLESWRTGQGRTLAASAYLLSMVIGCGHFDGWFAPLHVLLLPLGTLAFTVWLVRHSGGNLASVHELAWRFRGRLNRGTSRIS